VPDIFFAKFEVDVTNLEKLGGHENRRYCRKLKLLFRLTLDNIRVEVVKYLDYNKENVTILHFANLCAVQNPVDKSRSKLL
jgi:hypothetical protein